MKRAETWNENGKAEQKENHKHEKHKREKMSQSKAKLNAKQIKNHEKPEEKSMLGCKSGKFS